MRQSPINRILILLKTEGPQLASSLGDALGISSEAARQQLTKMAEEGLVEPVAEAASGRGRPKQLCGVHRVSLWESERDGPKAAPLPVVR